MQRYKNFITLTTKSLGLFRLICDNPYIKYAVNGKEYVRKSLYVPGVGWCPATDCLLKDFTQDPFRLSLYCEKNSLTFVGRSNGMPLDFSWLAIGGHRPCERFDIYLHYMDVKDEIILFYKSIRNEHGCEHLPIFRGTRNKYPYFVEIKGQRIDISDTIYAYIQSSGFDNLRIEFRSDKATLIIPPEDKKQQFEEYDKLQISLNGYRITKPVLKGVEPYYFLEEDNWIKEKKHYLITPNKIIQNDSTIKSKPKLDIFTRSEEDEMNDLVDFFRPMGFSKSSQVSAYIREHELGYRYPNISGFLKLQKDGEEWELEGAIAPCYFAEICKRLGLEHYKNAEPVSYESYKQRGLFD